MNVLDLQRNPITNSDINDFALSIQWYAMDLVGAVGPLTYWANDEVLQHLVTDVHLKVVPDRYIPEGTMVFIPVSVYRTEEWTPETTVEEAREAHHQHLQWLHDEMKKSPKIININTRRTSPVG